MPSPGIMRMRVFSAAALAAAGLSAQITGDIKGLALDGSGAAVTRAVIKLVNKETGESRRQATDIEGRFAFNQLKVGAYRIEALAEGFKDTVAEAEVRSAETATVTFRLEIGQVTEAITVSGAVSPLDTNNAQIHASLDARRIGALPVGRNPILFALLAPGVVPVSSANPALNAGNYNVNGSRGRANNITIDNITSTDITTTGNGGQQASPLTLEQLEEVKLITHSFSAEYGRNSGSQLQFITKSGGNDFHGSAYEFLRNDLLNARDFFDRSGKAAVVRRNQFGYALGGPIVRNRTHFFQTYEGTQLRGSGGTRIAQVPTPAMVSQITDPAARQLFEQYKLPVSASGTVQQSAASFLKAFQFSFRADHQISERDTLTARYAHYQQEESSAGITFFVSNLADFGARGVSGPRNFNLAETHLFSESLVNEFRFGYGRSSPFFAANPATALGPRIEFANAQVDRFGIWEGLPQGRVHNVFQFSDTVSWIRGAHNWKAGADLHRYQANSMFDLTMRGLFRFNNWDDFALGRPILFTQRFGGSVRGHRVTNHFYFLQDDWKATRHLTINLGMRVEVAGGVSEVNGLTSNLEIGCREPIGAAGSGAFGCLTTGRPSNGTGINWGPRLGFAWNPRGDARTVVRGGYGMVYDFVYLNPITNQRFLPPFIATASLTGAAAFTGSNSLANLVAGSGQIQAEGLAGVGRINPAAVNFGAISPAIDTGLRNPQVQQWSFSVEREALRGLVLKAAYVGS
ncbi:MAG: TonB-dependent receptor, partial [Acidobacteria bacterium]|nr:TonB-dependent receptor [Acidobacteriota bacterium]